jgi:hypothetical protein
MFSKLKLLPMAAALVLGGLAAAPAEAGWRGGYGYGGGYGYDYGYRRPVVVRDVYHQPIVHRVVYRDVYRPVVYRYRRPVVRRVVYRDVYRPAFYGRGYGHHYGWRHGYGRHYGWRNDW